MSLIVAKIEGSRFYIVGDTKLTYPEEQYPDKSIASPKDGVIKSVILNEHVCISFSCDDIQEAESAIIECRKMHDNISRIIEYLLKVNIETKGEVEFLICVSLYPIIKMYEIKQMKKIDTKYSWIGSLNGYNIFQEKLANEKAKPNKRPENSLSDLGSAMDEVIKSGRENSVNGFRITVTNNNGIFEYESYISVALPPRTIEMKSGEPFFITHGTAEEGGYNVHIFPSERNYKTIAIHIMQGRFGVLYNEKDGGLLWPKVINDVDEIEFSEYTKEKFGISPHAVTYSPQRSHFERGNRAFKEKDYHKAIEHYDIGLNDEDPALKPNLFYNKGLALYNLRKPSEAILCFTEAMKLDKRFESLVQQVLYRTQRPH